MRIFGLVGRSGSGKTTLMVRLIPALTARGLSVSSIKHAHHGFDLDRPGKDSFRHREAGAREVMLVSDTRWALLGDEPASIETLIARMAPVDLLLVEGFHAHERPTLEIHRPSAGHALLWRPGSPIIAVASDEALAGVGVPVLDLNDIERIAAFVIANAAEV